MKKSKYILLAILTLGSTACSDSFFETAPSDKVVTTNFFKDQSDFDYALIGCYQRLKSEVGFLLTEIEYRGDSNDLLAVAVSTQDRYDLDHFQETPGNGILGDLWNVEYNAIYRCNMVLDRIDAMDFAKKDQFKGEALFLRAWYYFTLYRVFGGVPIADQVISPADAAKIVRASDQQMKEFITGDLSQAAMLLPSNYSGAEIGRATNCAANTLLGKVCLTFGDAGAAKTALENAMANKNFGLAKTTSEACSAANKMNKEMILAVRYNKSLNLGHGTWYNSTNPALATNPTEFIKTMYQASDNRAALIGYTKLGTAYMLTKYYDTYDATYTTVIGSDFPLLRYADTELLYAEALNQIGYNTDAFKYINDIRTRAGIDELKETDITNQKDFRKALLDERQREFAYEGQRWFDLVRLGYAVEVMQGLGYSMDSHNLIMPIPQSQIEIVNNTDILWQNPGFNR